MSTEWIAGGGASSVSCSTVCILHEPAEKLLARRLADDLVASGVSANAELGELQPGEALGAWTGRGVLGASVLVVLITDSMVGRHRLADLVPVANDAWLREWRVIVGRIHGGVPLAFVGVDTVDFTDYDAGFAALAACL